MESTGLGIAIGGSVSALPSDKVSPVVGELSFETAPISPAETLSVGSCFLPFIKNMLLIFSSVSLFAFFKIRPLLSVPSKTLKNDSLPTNGSTTVLNICKTTGALGSHLSSTLTPFSSVAIAVFSAGDGSVATILLRRLTTPLFA